jgi:hypothetical protein
MNHKTLEQIKGGAFLAGDLPMSTSSKHYIDVNAWCHAAFCSFDYRLQL